MKALFKSALQYMRVNDDADTPLYAHADIGNGEKIMLICYKGTVERFNKFLKNRELK